MSKAFDAVVKNAGGGETTFPNPLGPGTLKLITVPLGCGGDCGYLFAASQDPDFPTQTDRLILGVAANQAAIVLQHKRSEQQVRRSEQELTDFFDNATVGLHWVGGDGTILRANRAELNLLGYSAEEYIGHHIAEFHVDRHVIDDILSRLWAGEGVRKYEARLRCKDGSIRQVLIDSSVLWDDGRFVHTRCFTRDITEQKQAEETRLRLLNELKESDRRKDEFLATLAHELRNPLAPIRSAVKVLHLKGADNAEARWGREVIERQVGHLTRLIDDLLEISRITRNELELRKRCIELSEVINGAIEASRPLIEASEHELTVALPDEPVYLDGDLVRLAQVFLNLLNNAAKYTERGGRIWLTARRDGDTLIATVKDTGMGIAAEKLPHLFQMFYQVDRSLERSQGGLGIGLSLARRLVEFHGGTVQARSAGVGQGSEFIVTLPVRLQEPERRPVQANDSGHNMATGRILVADDNRDSAESLSMFLRLNGNEVDTVYDGVEAVEAAARFRPDVVLLDIGMPRLNGEDACRQIRATSWGHDMMLVALTGWGQEEDRRRTVEAGFDAHLVKPVDPTEVMKLLASRRPAQGTPLSGR